MIYNCKRYSTAPPPPPAHSSRFAPYRQALKAVAERTRTPLPSLVLSFAILHELTAIVPLMGFFFGARALGVGERIVSAFPETSKNGEMPVEDNILSDAHDGWVVEKSKQWWGEGSKWAERVGQRYGVFGFEKRGGPIADMDTSRANTFAQASVSGKIAGDAANAIVAYWLTKALVPVRIGISLYLSPAFSRRLVEPIRISVLRALRRRPPMSDL
ncbi:hypothetical protein AcW1_003833 [Taiwanofungus camphoratus]|nr:hypothetical protein AcW1_003833 [Antrodia cinnamomea]KAI0944117.1 hypothetical protein AcV7_002028 [Antrodia cinnamomea]